MALPMSPEFPDFYWGGPPRAYGTGRDGKAVRYLVVHYTAGAEGRTSAEDGAAYDRRRADGTSCHAFADADTVVQEVLTSNRSNSAFSKGNRLGVHLEICGTLQTSAQWADPTSDATLWQAARFAAAVCQKYSLPVRRMSVAEVRRAWYSFPTGANVTGICGHVDITDAYPEDGGTHTDPGPQFPWSTFLARVQQLLDQLRGPVVGSDKGDEIMILAQITGKAGVFAGNGQTYRTVRYPETVARLLAAGANGKFLAPSYGVPGAQPLPDLGAVEDLLGIRVYRDDDPDRPDEA